VVNEESIVAFALLTVFWAVARYGGPAYASWADGQIAKMKGILNSARDNHTQAVKDRIETVQQLGGVVDITKTLFEVSKVSKAEMNDIIGSRSSDESDSATGNRTTRSPSV
jgi:F-type H+-transporting ATPase subunit b